MVPAYRSLQKVLNPIRKSVAEAKDCVTKGGCSVGEAYRISNDIQKERAFPEWLLIKKDDRSVFLRVADIDWIESSRNNVRLHVGKEVYVFHETTSGIEAKLDPKKFFRIHRSTIVNIEKIKEMHPWFNGDYAVTLKDGTKLTLSSTYRERLKEFRRLAV